MEKNTIAYNNAIWDAINYIAKQHGKSCSGFAMLCGLDATAFNTCKRLSKYGQPRWPSSETLIKVLYGARMTLTQFAQIVESFVQDSKK